MESFKNKPLTPELPSIAEIRSGDSNAESAVMEYFLPIIQDQARNYARRFRGTALAPQFNEDDCAEKAQEVLLKAIRNLPLYIATPAELKRYSMRIIRNSFVDLRRSVDVTQRIYVRNQDTKLDQLPSPVESPEILPEEKEAILAAVKSILRPSVYKILETIVEHPGSSTEEIGRLLGKRKEVICAYITQLHQALRDYPDIALQMREVFFAGTDWQPPQGFLQRF